LFDSKSLANSAINARIGRLDAGAGIAQARSMAKDNRTPQPLRYLETARLDAPLFDPLEILTRHGVKLGTFDGVVVDPVERCVRYLVVDRGRLFHQRRLIPFVPIRVDTAHHALHLEFDEIEPLEWQKFDARNYPPFSDDDLIAAIFSRRRTLDEN
jgi:hypothetical protein